ncbi:MAG: 50S ribosomal protein L24 [Chloroflexi bacterium]|uniref:Large ribosomal subunit protein uL24 n=1 Tax=Candidatus Chlorohelix allophototropha TaxID=3003348 RepID=A0A8T7LYX9_9CHLR|nr:50S ribosomal protein L24 [Chloroflexota bacterium]WJW65638.1 50S ribosomal protein L24 [Chloroflexota bacterium L227-S17]
MAKVRKGDTVQVITGKYKQKRGTVKRVLPESNKVIVEGVNIVKRHIKARSQIRQTGIVEVEAPLQVSNVMLVCPRCNEAVRIGFREENNEKVRFCKNSACGATIPDATGWVRHTAD